MYVTAPYYLIAAFFAQTNIVHLTNLAVASTVSKSQ